MVLASFPPDVLKVKVEGQGQRNETGPYMYIATIW